MDDNTLFSLFQDILNAAGVSRLSQARYELVYHILHKGISLFIAGFAIINTVVSFTDTSLTLRQVMLAVNMIFVSGLLGDFGNRSALSRGKKANLDFVIKSLADAKNNLGLAQSPPLPLQPDQMIIDGNIIGMPFDTLIPVPRTSSFSGVTTTHLAALISGDSKLKSRVASLESILTSLPVIPRIPPIIYQNAPRQII